jgi:hypothetical protein
MWRNRHWYSCAHAPVILDRRLFSACVSSA